MDREWWIGSGAAALMGLSLGFTGVALYDGVIRYPQWERAHRDLRTSEKYSPQPLTQMEPSWQLYGIASVSGALAGSSAFALTSRRGRESQTRSLSGRVGTVTQ